MQMCCSEPGQRRETFNVEYGIYLAIILVCVGACSVKVWQLGAARRAEQALLDDRADRQDAPAKDRPVGLTQARHVPTPWGWPGSFHSAIGGNGGQPGDDNSHGALHRWVDQLVTEKQTVDDGEYRKKREASMRALLEDRFHSPSHKKEGVRGTNGKPAGGVSRNLPDDPGKDVRVTAGNRSESAPLAFDEPLSGVKTPWGW